MSDALGRAMAHDRYARPDAATFGRLLAQAGKLMPDEVPRTDLRHPGEGARRRPSRMDRDRLVYPGPASRRRGLRASRPPVPAAAGALLSGGRRSPLWSSSRPSSPWCGRSPAGCSPWPSSLPRSSRSGRDGASSTSCLAVPTMALLRWRRLEWAALLPGVMPVAVGLGSGTGPAAAGRASCCGAGEPLVGFMSGLVLVVAAGLGGWPDVPFTFNPGPGRAAHGGADSRLSLDRCSWRSPASSIPGPNCRCRSFSSPCSRCLLYAWLGASRERRMWGAIDVSHRCCSPPSCSFPSLVLGVPVELVPFPGRLCAVRYNRVPVRPSHLVRG